MERGTVTPPMVAGPLRLAPFRAWRLSANHVGDPASARLFAHPGRDALDRLTAWERRGAATHHDRAALWLHEYTASGMTVRGIVGALSLAHRTARPEDRAILPHEGVYPAQADDLADRLHDMGVNPAPILLVQRSEPSLRDHLRQVRHRDPFITFTDHAGQTHRLWELSDPVEIDMVNDALEGSRALIADGHHRYAAYLRLQQRHPGTAADQGLAMLVDRDDTDLFLGAIHRLLVGASVDDLEVSALSVGMHTQSLPSDQALAALSPGTLLATDGERWLAISPDLPHDGLEVATLHDQLVPALGRGPTRITYHHSVHDVLRHTAAGQSTAVLLPAASIDRVERIVVSNRLMPEKATSFQPKPSAGVLMRSLHDEGFDPGPSRSRTGTGRPRRRGRTGGGRRR